MTARTRVVALAAALALGCLMAPVAAAGQPQPDQACAAVDIQRGFFGDTVSQTVAPTGTSVSSFDVELGFTQRWSRAVVGRLVRIRPVGNGTQMGLQTQTLAEVSRQVTGKAYSVQWVHFPLPQPVDAATTAALGTLAIQVADLPPPGQNGRAVAAWMRCSEEYPGGQVYGTGNVFLPGQTVSTPAQSGLNYDAVFRLFA